MKMVSDSLRQDPFPLSSFNISKPLEYSGVLSAGNDNPVENEAVHSTKEIRPIYQRLRS